MQEGPQPEEEIQSEEDEAQEVFAAARAWDRAEDAWEKEKAKQFEHTK